MLIATVKHQVKDLWAELGRVDWPTWEKVRGASISVIFVSVFVGLFLYGADLVIARAAKLILPHH
jgi:preprotein translocase subunit SecE